MGSCMVTYSYEASEIVKAKVRGNSMDVTFCDLHSDGGIQNVKMRTQSMDAWVSGTRRRGDAERVEDDRVIVCVPHCEYLAKSLLRNREEAITANVKGLGYGW